MAWTAPRTWTDGEVVTAAMMNAHLAANMSVIKAPRTDLGRLSALSSATLADLSSASLTGLASPAAGNAFTAGRTRLQAASFVLPVGADKYQDLGGGLRRGLWVEGDYLHHIKSNQATEYRYLGSVVSTPAGALPGSFWIEGNDAHYIDASGVERKCTFVYTNSADQHIDTTHTDAGAIGGSVWIETYLHWIRESGSAEKPGHLDVAHQDGTPHYDSHGDVTHLDAHADVGHGDISHGDISHGDVVHEDIAHGDHNDGPHYDEAHQDLVHGDRAHTDSHTDSPYSDDHDDRDHTNTHSDHLDHADVVHNDQPTVVS